MPILALVIITIIFTIFAIIVIITLSRQAWLRAQCGNARRLSPRLGTKCSPKSRVTSRPEYCVELMLYIRVTPRPEYCIQLMLYKRVLQDYYHL